MVSESIAPAAPTCIEHGYTDSSASSELQLDHPLQQQQPEHSAFLRPRDELIARVRDAPSVELALEIVMDAEPLEATIANAK